MREHPVMSSARTVIPSSFGSPITAATTLLMTGAMTKYLGISAQSVAGSQIMHREAITAGVVDAELR